jgi:TIGR03009 family protein
VLPIVMILVGVQATAFAQATRPPGSSVGNPAAKNANPAPAAGKQNGNAPASGPATGAAPSKAANGGSRKPADTSAIPKNGAANPGGRAGDGPKPVDGPKGVDARPQQPKWFPLSADEQAYVDDVLKVWEQQSSKIQHFRCSFVRFRYDPAFGPYETAADGRNGKLHPAELHRGVIYYQSPNKGLIRVDKVEKNNLQAGSSSDRWEPMNAAGEYWMCNGKALFFLNHADKTLVESPIPAGMQGKDIVNSPLPFVFGARAGQVKDRFWIRPLAAESDNEARLEFVPRTAADASNYKRVQVILEEQNKEVTPKGLWIQNHDNTEDSYLLEDREKNWNMVLDKLKNPFQAAFDQPVVPKGYKKVTERDEPAAAPVQAQRGGGPVQRK